MSHILLTPPARPPHDDVAVPGSKSYTNRALVAAALADGESLLAAASESADSRALAAALGRLGVAVGRTDAGWRVAGGPPRPYGGTIDAGPAGTTLRFLVSLLCVTPGVGVELCGSERMHQRPIGDLVEAWRRLGARIDYLGRSGCPPLGIRGAAGRLGDRVTISGATSSQFVSSLLLAAPALPDGLTVEVDGEQASRPYVDMTLETMRAFGIAVDRDGYRRYRVAAGQRYRARRYEIEGDASAASYLWGLAAISGGTLRVRDVRPDSTQGDVRFVGLLERMGCRVRHGTEAGRPWIEVASDGRLEAIDADLSSLPDVAPTLAVVGAAARGSTRVRGLRTLRLKESDRIAALHEGLTALGIDCEPDDDALIVHGGEPRPGRVRTHGDHRIAMSFAMLAGRFPGIEIERPQVVDKSYPGFWDALGALGIGVSGTS